jgi:hypothetical protein
MLSSTVIQRALARFCTRQRFINLSVSNVPGPPVPLYLAGAPILEMIPVQSIMGNLTVGVVVLSYAGQLNFTVVADRDSCPDVEVLADEIRNALDQLASLSRQPLRSFEPTPTSRAG